MGMHEHKRHAPQKVFVAVLSVSSTRTPETDEGGYWIKETFADAGHEIRFYQVIKDDLFVIRDTLKQCLENRTIQAVIMTGGTGIAEKDVTIEAARPFFEKELTGFSVLFTQLSHQQIGAAAMLSRATAGIGSNTLVFCIPGSLNACKLACTQLILPELGHLVKHMAE